MWRSNALRLWSGTTLIKTFYSQKKTLLLNELLILQVSALITLVFFTTVLNLLTLWYLAGIYLVLLGWLALLDDGDIFIGFLWVIDLGVGLVFFIFILHYSTFLHQKSNVDKTSRSLSFFGVLAAALLAVYALAPLPRADLTSKEELLVWTLSVSWYDYYDIFFSQTITDLNLLHEIYFTLDSFEFFVINFFLLYGIVGSILMTFLIKRVFVYLNATQLVNHNLLSTIGSSFFIRNQDFLKQQGTSAGQRVWIRSKGTRL